MASEERFEIGLEQQADYAFEVRFDDPQVPPLLMDEPPPLGRNAGPSPVRLLAAGVANCLCASLLFALRKYRHEPGPMRARAEVQLGRNAQRRLRVQGMRVEIRLGVPATQLPMLERALAQFEDFCVVTQSVRAAFPVEVRVLDGEERLVHPAAPALA